MSTKKRILFIASEMSPYLEMTEFSETVNKLAVLSNNSGLEIRCIMPRFGSINERRHRLHEVVRLSGINVTVDNDDYPLQIKVASLPNARLQVYFLDNEELFKRKNVFADDDDVWFEDNDIRTIFFCKGALETVKKFGWPPDIIHCSGWMTGLIPMYLKTIYKKEPVFAHSKIIYTLGPNTFEHTISDNFLSIANISEQLKDKDLSVYEAGTEMSMQIGGATYADAITFGDELVDESLKTQFAKAKGKKIIKYSGHPVDLTEYLQLYTDLA
ncbi:glycogen/starch synthase [Polluticaenibacter yanchengensis]|uniref:starch synthase n=1 Tax=Polluticaenibacter yanchengensis TaxID=3014562 RepID=A0ABT4UKQ5_9BACT|nr:glycogen/starch synthase [Chitinophagaceae bacterium LY-5]